MKLKRKEELMEYIRANNVVSFEELCKKFKVSLVTIRRDINELQKEGYIKKVHGGVSFIEDDIKSINQREIEFFDEKAAIGRAAAELVSNGDVIIIDAGSTTAHMIPYLKEKKVTVITNAINILESVIPYPNIQVISTGGKLIRETSSLIGVQAGESIKKLNAQWAFLGATGVSLVKGVTNSSLEEGEIKKSMIEVAMQKVLLVDHSKFDVVSLVKFAELTDLDMIITDQIKSQDVVRYKELLGEKLIILK